MTLRIGTPVRWPNPPLGWRRGVIVAIFMAGDRPDFAPFCDVRRYSARRSTSYLVRDHAGAVWWPMADHLEAIGYPPSIAALTAEERAWCEAHPDVVRAAIKSISTAGLAVRP